jgi:hypothetical protein
VLKRLERTPETEHIFKVLEKDYPALRLRQNDNSENDEMPQSDRKLE